MIKISAYKSLDDTIHTDELDAIMSDFKVEIRGLIQSKTQLREDRIGIPLLLDMIALNSMELRDVINKYQTKIRGYNSRKKPAPVTA